MRLLGFKLEKRIEPPSTIIKILSPVLAIVVAFAVISFLLLLRGSNLQEAMGSFFGVLGSKTGIAEIAIRMSALLTVGLGVAIAFKCSVFNIGGEGQFVIGAIVATWVGITIAGPSVMMFILITIICFLAGGAWGGL